MLSAYQNEIKRLRQMLKAVKEPSPDAAAAGGLDDAGMQLVDRKDLERLQAANQQARLEKSVIVSELARQQQEMQKAKREKEEYESRIRELQAGLIQGGTRIEDTDAFKQAIDRERERLQQEHEVGWQCSRRGGDP